MNYQMVGSVRWNTLPSQVARVPATCENRSVRYILFPGRHHLVTAFQVDHLRSLLEAHPDAQVVWAITSADHGGTQRNPISGPRRLGLIESVATAAALPSLTFLIGNRRPKPDFAHYVLEEIRTQSGAAVAMRPENTIVACSTPDVMAGYEALGYAIDPVELGTDQIRPWQVVEQIIDSGAEWETQIAGVMHPAAVEYYRRYGLAVAIQSIYSDPLIDSDDGDITVTRDYATYRAAFEDNAWRKVDEFAYAVRAGRIVDVGCATGQTIKLLSERPELFESDFYGVEVARPLYEICEQRKSNGEFGDANVFFHQRNIMQTQLFEPDSLDTVISMALTHEIESYLGRDELLAFCSRVFTMLRPGGVWINYDVVGPDAGDDLVVAEFTVTDGLEDGELGDLSSRARFDRFVHDFRHDEGDGISCEPIPFDGRDLIRLKRSALYEFLAKKDYVDSWFSEAHETFCHFEPADWVALLEQTGFEVTPQTRPIQNPWLIENRFAPAAHVYVEDDEGGLVPDEWSWTNILLVARKPE